MITFKKINLNRPYYFFSDKISIKNVDRNILSIGKIPYKNTDAAVYTIKYIRMEIIFRQNIDIENTLCVSFSDVDLVMHTLLKKAMKINT